MRIIIDWNVAREFPGLRALAVLIENSRITTENPELESLMVKAIEDVKSKYNIESLNDVPSIRAYRDFFWRIKLDPTKSRPSAEALIRRILLGKPLLKINTFVDSLNITSIKSEVAISSFDVDKLVGDTITIRRARAGEEFYGIGMNKPAMMRGYEIVLSDDNGLIAVYPHRDAERTKITEETRRAILVFCGVPGVGMSMLNRAINMAVDLIIKFCGGNASPIEVGVR
ncbi:MAG: phenylalanine--tRNA ligase beta subunit-related protein [Candidatus Bathyarchaeia archaeon]